MLKTHDADEENGAELLDTRVKPVVRVVNGSLDEDPTSPSAIVLNGRIDPSTLRFLKVDQTYQRPLGDRRDIFDAFKAQTVVPNIEVGVRGNSFKEDGDDYLISDPVYIIDGWQRVGTALKILEQDPNYPIRIFATVHFGTSDTWERHRFTDLNKNVMKVSANLHLRNMRDQNNAVLTIYGLCNNTKDFPLYKKTCWSQNMHRDELTTAANIARAARALHSHKSAGGASAGVKGLTDALFRQASVVGLQKFRANIITFFSVVDDCWGIRSIEYRKSAPQLRSAFLQCLARVFSAHDDFWDATGSTLFVSADHKRKLKTFPLHDPQIVVLTSQGGNGSGLLYQLLVNHMNSGKRAHRLRSRYDREDT